MLQCLSAGGSAPSNWRIVSGGKRSLKAISSAVGSRPVACHKFRQVRKTLLKAAMLATDNWPSIALQIVLEVRSDWVRSARFLAHRRPGNSQDRCGSIIGKSSMHRDRPGALLS
jgi:hypothetical protein